jgi:two-component system, NtrC family, response regulator AtoC
MAPRALILHCDRKTAEAGREVLDSSGYRSVVATDFGEAMALVESECPQLLLLDSNATAINYPPLCEINGRGAVVAVAAFDTLQAAVSALKEHGAGSAVDRAIPYPKLLLQSFGCGHATQLPVASPLGVVGVSPALKESVELARKAARSEASILLSGESGTGKELAARTIHSNSSRAARAFVPVDCASLPESLLEAELFGYEKGAFTGAVATKPGLMEAADHGTLFLDEIGELAVSLQAKLFRALQEREHRRVGGTHNIKFDVRVIAATNRDLQQRVKEGKFREDLLFRLNVIPIRLPPLRERDGDVALLANYFLDQYAEADTGITKIFDSEVLRFFESCPWPGNVRELQNVVRRMSVLSEKVVITTRDLPKEMLSSDRERSLSPPATATPVEPSGMSFLEAKRQYLGRFEAAYLRGILDRHTGNISRAAEAAEIDRKTFYRLLRKHKMQPLGFRTWNRCA